jgi:nucleotide-binding universal stress UspA family protein
MSTIHTILVPTDFSEYSDAAFRFASSLASEQDARLIVLHVNPPPTLHGEVIDRRQPNGYYDRLWEELYARKPDDPRTEIAHKLREGDAVEEILEAAREEKCDLIVMGTHGRSGLGRLLLGSIAEKVIREAPCPVLTINRPLSHTLTQGVKNEAELSVK